jgi:hypothetical protein
VTFSSAAWQEIRVGMTKERAALPFRIVADGKAGHTRGEWDEE